MCKAIAQINAEVQQLAPVLHSPASDAPATCDIQEIAATTRFCGADFSLHVQAKACTTTRLVAHGIE